MDPKSNMTDVLIERMLCGETHTEGRGHMKMENRSDTSITQRALMTAGKPPEAGKRQNEFFPFRFQNERDPANSLVSGFWPPEL